VTEPMLFRELTARPVPAELREELTGAARSLTDALRPRLKLLEVDGDSVTMQNFVGSARLASDSILEVSPKVDASTNWAEAVVQLLEPDTRIAVTGSMRSTPSARNNDLSSALALEYARRLESALRSDGSLHVYEHLHKRSRRLQGRLDVTKWVRSAVLNPAMFPISRDELTPANDFNRGLSIVAGWLSRAASDAVLHARLRRLQAAVIPGHPVQTYVNPAVAARTIPSQWARFVPAWSIAASLLRNRSVVGDPGRAVGLEVAVESWPLLETALKRALLELARTGGYGTVPKANHPILRFEEREVSSVIPDGILTRDGAVVATFECKYTRPSQTPDSAHVYQALATAAALSSPLSVLVYPGTGEVRRHTTVGFNGRPAELVSLGLDVFSYRRGIGDVERAAKISAAVHDDD